MQFRVTITESPVCVAHQLHLPYISKCNTLHGHNYTVEVVLVTDRLNEQGMVDDFTFVKGVVKKYDHTFLGPMPKGAVWPGLVCQAHVEPSTAENFAAVLFREIGDNLRSTNPNASVHSVSVWETPNNKVTVTTLLQIEEDAE